MTERLTSGATIEDVIEILFERGVVTVTNFGTLYIQERPAYATGVHTPQEGEVFREVRFRPSAALKSRVRSSKGRAVNIDIEAPD
jgi:nucleoid DNA-binding protein